MFRGRDWDGCVFNVLWISAMVTLGIFCALMLVKLALQVAIIGRATGWW